MKILVARFYEDRTWQSDVVDSPEKAVRMVLEDDECIEVVVGTLGGYVISDLYADAMKRLTDEEIS